jgi:hypothetical protein
MLIVFQIGVSVLYAAVLIDLLPKSCGAGSSGLTVPAALVALGFALAVVCLLADRLLSVLRDLAIVGGCTVIGALNVYAAMYGAC